MHFRRFVLACAIVFAPSAVVADPQADAEYIASQTVTREMFEGILAVQRPVIVDAVQHRLSEGGILLPNPNRFFDLIMEEFVGEFTDGMRDQTADIYLAAFSPEHLAEIAAFYKSEAGQAMIAATPGLMMAGAEMGEEAGRRAGANAGRRAAQRLESEGLIIVEDPALLRKLIDAMR